MQDRTINNALIALYKAGGQQGEVAGQLLHLRDVEPPRLVSRCEDPFRRNQMRTAILEALRDGPRTGPDIVRHVMGYRDGRLINKTENILG